MMNTRDHTRLSAVAPETIVLDDLVGVALVRSGDATAAGTIHWANAAFATLVGRAADSVEGMGLDELLEGVKPASMHDDLRSGYEQTVRLATGNGSIVVQLSPTDHVDQVVVVASPAHGTPRAAMFDAVTGLASLALFREHLQLGLNRRSREGDDIAVVTVGAPSFATAWQERKGAASVLQSRMGERIEQVVRDADVLAARRPGSFLLLVNDPSDAAAAATLVSERMIDAFATPLVLTDGLQPLTLAIGIGASDNDDEPDHVIRRADDAYARAAADGPNLYRIEQPTH